MEVAEVRKHLESAFGKRWRRQICRPDYTLGGPLCEQLIERVVPYCEPNKKYVSGINADEWFVLRYETLKEIAKELGRGDYLITCGDTLWSTILVAGFREGDPWPPPDLCSDHVDCRDI